MKRSRHTISACLAVVVLLGGLLLPLVSPGAQSLAPETTAAAPGLTQVADSSDYYREPGAGAMIIDGLVVRPLAFVSTLIGGVIYVVTLPFSALGGNAGEAGEKLVVAPAAYTFTRCLGCFYEWR